MKRLAHILVILLLLLSAGQAWAIDIYNENGETPIATVGPEALQNYSLKQINASIPYATGRDRVALIQERTAQIAPERERAGIRERYIRAFWGDNSVPYQNEFTDKVLQAAGVIANPINNTVDGAITKAKQIAECGASVGCWVLQAAVWTLQGFRVVLSWFLSAANILLNLSIDLSVRNFKDRVGVGLQEAWKIFRDLVNLTFIFTLLYVAIGTILQLDQVNTKKMLTRVIIAALLVNFSFLFTSVMIDASNVVANGLYSAAGKGVDGDGNAITTNLTGGPDIVSALLGTSLNPANEASGIAMGIDQKLHGATTDITADTRVNQLKREASGLVGQIILLVISTTVFMAGAILFIIRALVLLFVLAASPVAFLAFSIGGGTLDKIGSKWKNALSSQLIFAPAFMLFILMSIKVTQSLNLETQSGGDSFFNLLLAYLVANGLMLGSLMVAKEMGVAGAAMATKAAGGINRFALKTIGGATGGFVGGTAKSAYGGLKEVAKGVQSGGWKGVRDVGVGLRKVATSPFVGAATGATKGLSVITSSGGNIKGKIADTFKKPDEAFNKAVSSITGVEILGEVKDKKKTQEEKEDNEKQKTKATAQKIANQINGNKLTPGSQEEAEAEKAIKKMKDKNVVKLDATTLKTLAHLFSENQVKAIEKDNDIDDATKEAIRARREQKMSQLEDVLRSNLGGENATVGTTLAQTPTALIAKLVNDLDDKDADYKNILQTIASNLGTGRLEQLRNSGEINKRNRLQEIRRRAAGAATASPTGTTTTQTTTVASVTPTRTGSNRSYEWPSPRNNNARNDNTNPQNIDANINYHEGRN